MVRRWRLIGYFPISTFFDSAQCLMVRRWRLIGHFPILYNPLTAMQKVANRDLRDFGCEIAHAAVSRRPPISLSTIVARTPMYTYAAKVGSAHRSRNIFCRPVRYDSQLLHRCATQLG
jgi:hypothetical protein